MSVRNGIILTALVMLLPLGIAVAEDNPGPATKAESHTTKVSAQIDALQPVMVASKEKQPEADDDNAVIKRTYDLGVQPLDLRYAGTTTTDGGTGNALALVFTRDFAPEGSFSDYILVIDAEDHHVGGRWHVASNARVLFFPIAEAGEYRVILTPGLKDRNGDVLRQRYQGTIIVK